MHLLLVKCTGEHLKGGREREKKIKKKIIDSRYEKTDLDIL